MNSFHSRAGFPRRKRQAERAPVLMPASIVTMSAYRYPELLDISQCGAKLRGSSLPPKGTMGLFRVDALEVLCRVVWANEDQCGIRFDEPISPRSLKQIQLDGSIALDTLGPSERAKEELTEAGAD